MKLVNDLLLSIYYVALFYDFDIRYPLMRITLVQMSKLEKQLGKDQIKASNEETIISRNFKRKKILFLFF